MSSIQVCVNGFRGVLSQDDGTFHIEKIQPGTYLLMIRNVEFKTWISDPVMLKPGVDLDVKNILLETKVNKLEEVIVATKKAPVEVHPDKIVFNVNSSINTSGNNSLELLAKAPGVIIDPDKNIIVMGKSGVHIYINGQPSRLKGNDLVIMLEGMRSDDIESVEIITNPSANDTSHAIISPTWSVLSI